MGLKSGFAIFASEQKLFVALSGHPYGFAHVKCFFEGDRLKSFLLYPDGSVGLLNLNQYCQLNVGQLIKRHWVPTSEQMMAIHGKVPPELIVFRGEYQVGEVTSRDLSPQEEHRGLDRFVDPLGLWNQAVAKIVSPKEGVNYEK